MILSVSCQYDTVRYCHVIPYSLEAVVCLCRFNDWAFLVARLQCGRPGFDPWVGKIPWRREGLPTPVFWPGEFHGLYSSVGHKESDMTEQVSLHFTGLGDLLKESHSLAHSEGVRACSFLPQDIGLLTSPQFSIVYNIF